MHRHVELQCCIEDYLASLRHVELLWFHRLAERATLAEGSATFEAMASYQDQEDDHHDDDGEADGQPNLLGAVPSPGRA